MSNGDGGIAHRWDLFSEAPALVFQRFYDMMNFAINGYTQAMQSIQNLAQIAGSLKLITQTITIDTENISEPEIEATPPVIDTSQFKVNYPNTPILEPTLIDATMDPISKNFPNLIGPGDVNAGPLTYVSDLMTSLKKWITQSMTDMSTGVPASVEDAMFKRNYERDLLEYEDEQDRIAANWGKGGFPFPNGGLRAAKDRASMQFTDKRLDTSREIMIKSWEISLNNMHFVIGQGVAVEGLMIRWAETTATRIFQASVAEIDKYIKTYDAEVKGFSEQAKIIIEKCKAKIEYNIGMIRMYEASVNAYAAQMNAEAQRINAVARGYEAEVDVFNSIVNFDVKKVELDLKVIQARIDQAVANAGILIKNEEVQLKAYEVLNSLKEEAQKAIGQIASTVASGALSAVHAQVHIGASDEASYSAGSQLTSNQ